jgi:amphi-Trp domain-containing protein
MERPDIDLVHDAMHEPAQVARYLRALAEGLETGVLRLRSGEREVELHPMSLCTFELRTTSERQRVKLHVQLGWREAHGGRGDAFEITSR